MLNLDLLIKKIVYFHELKDYKTCLNTVAENKNLLLEYFPQFFIEVLKSYYNMLLNNYDRIDLSTINNIVDSYMSVDDNNTYKVVVNLVLLKYVYYKIQDDSNFKYSTIYHKIYNLLTTSPHNLYILGKLIKTLSLEPVNKTNIHTDNKNIHLDSIVELFDNRIFVMFLNCLQREEVDE